MQNFNRWNVGITNSFSICMTAPLSKHTELKNINSITCIWSIVDNN